MMISMIASTFQGHSATWDQTNTHERENAPTTEVNNPIIDRSQSTDSFTNFPVFKSVENVHNV